MGDQAGRGTTLWEAPEWADEQVRQELDALAARLNGLVDGPVPQDRFPDVLRALSQYGSSLHCTPALLELLNRAHEDFVRRFPDSPRCPEVEYLHARTACDLGFRRLMEQARPAPEQWRRFLAGPKAQQLHRESSRRFLAVADAYPRAQEAGLSLVWAAQTIRLADGDYHGPVKPIYDRLMTEWKDDPRVMQEALNWLIDVKHVLEGPPPFSVPATDGREMSLEAHRCQVVLLHFWATWCAPCQAEHERLKDLHERFAGRGLVVLGIASESGGEGDREEFLRFVARQGIPWPECYDYPAHVSKLYGIQHVPYSLLIDQGGQVVSAGFLGPDMEEHIARLLGPLPAD